MGDFANIAEQERKAIAAACLGWRNSRASGVRRISWWMSQESHDSRSRYFDKGIMAMIGRNAAVAEVGEHRHELEGVIAFAAWLGVHALC